MDIFAESSLYFFSIACWFFKIGPYGAFHCAFAYIRTLQRAKSRAKHTQFVTDLNKVITLCQEIR